jgi:hypothetical protein
MQFDVWQGGKPPGSIWQRRASVILEIRAIKYYKSLPLSDYGGCVATAMAAADAMRRKLCVEAGVTMKNEYRFRQNDLLGIYVEVKLSRGVTMITNADQKTLQLIERHSWHATPKKRSGVYYVSTHVGHQKKAFFHSLLTGYKLVDHVNRNTLDNRKENLREATVALNNKNKRIFCKNDTGRAGIRTRPERRGFIVMLGILHSVPLPAETHFT